MSEALSQAPPAPGRAHALLTVRIGWRNLWRNRRRTWLTAGGIAFAVWLVVSFMALQLEQYAVMAENATALLAGQVQIQATEGGDAQVVEAAAALHDIGIHEAERKYGSAAGNYLEIEGPPIAREILVDFDLPTEKVDHICEIIANHHSAKNIDTTEFRCIWDADWLVNLPNEFDINNKEKI